MISCYFLLLLTTQALKKNHMETNPSGSVYVHKLTLERYPNFQVKFGIIFVVNNLTTQIYCL